ncbi:hypothetical protein [[Limnothrix rosea] IAM M-220]|uniref:hypothetical protein n=1 Tax=[Limnothrix rosea] IAM M-220 TaxID=454133 RepID=UPI00095DB2B3|nr:hypothetical protein [[Limnothrix rosea] IAM M-220]OKH14184.1 hypothetical protein NIES208_14145 [[Limnothrix rosea] IAM M-220]
MSTASSAVFKDPQFDEWLQREILRLSVDTLNKKAITCTACGEIRGDYIVDFQGETYRFDTPKTYAFLTYVLEEV